MSQEALREALLRSLQQDPDDDAARARLALLDGRLGVIADAPAVKPTKDYLHDFRTTWQLFYLKLFIPPFYIEGTLRARVQNAAGEEVRYIKPGYEFTFDKETGEIRWGHKSFPSHVLFQWSEVEPKPRVQETVVDYLPDDYPDDLSPDLD